MQQATAHPGSTNGSSSNPFDRALELRALAEAAEAYAARRGEPGSANYRRALLAFRQRFQTLEELRQWRAAAAARKPPAGPPRPQLRMPDPT